MLPYYRINADGRVTLPTGIDVICLGVQGVDVEEEFAALANKDIAQLCAENILLWQKFLDAFTLKEPIHQHLSKVHHQLRVSKRISLPTAKVMKRARGRRI